MSHLAHFVSLKPLHPQQKDNINWIKHIPTRIKWNIPSYKPVLLCLPFQVLRRYFWQKFKDTATSSFTSCCFINKFLHQQIFIIYYVICYYYIICYTLLHLFSYLHHFISIYYVYRLMMRLSNHLNPKELKDCTQRKRILVMHIWSYSFLYFVLIYIWVFN